MKASELLAALERHMEVYGDTYVSVRHETHHAFQPDDDLMDVKPRTNRENNMFTLQVTN